MGKQQDPPSFGHHLRHHCKQIIQLTGGIDEAGGRQLYQPWVAADLAQLEERVEHDDTALRGAEFGDLFPHLVVQRAADGFVQFPLLRREIDAAQDGVLRRQVGRNLDLRAAQKKGPDPADQLNAPGHVVVLLDWGTETFGKTFPVSQ